MMGHNIMPEECLPFHWENAAAPRRLQIRLADVETCEWSGGFTMEVGSIYAIKLRNAPSHGKYSAHNTSSAFAYTIE